LRGRQLGLPDDVAHDSAWCVRAVSESVGDQGCEDVRVQLGSVESDEVEFDRFAVHAREERLEWQLGGGTEEIGCQPLRGATGGSC